MAQSETTKVDQLASAFGDDARLSEALAAWKELPEAAQRRLAYEVAESRRDEILTMYTDAISVGTATAKSGSLARPGGNCSGAEDVPTNLV